MWNASAITCGMSSPLHQVVVLGDRHRDAGDVGFLEGVGADQRRGHLAGDRDDGDGVHLGVGDRGDQVGGARTRGGHARRRPCRWRARSRWRRGPAPCSWRTSTWRSSWSRTAGRRPAARRRRGCRRSPRRRAPRGTGPARRRRWSNRLARGVRRGRAGRGHGRRGGTAGHALGQELRISALSSHSTSVGWCLVTKKALVQVCTGASALSPSARARSGKYSGTDQTVTALTLPHLRCSAVKFSHPVEYARRVTQPARARGTPPASPPDG